MIHASVAVSSCKNEEFLDELPDHLGPFDTTAAGEGQEPWMAILVDELGQSFREFARESSRLARLVQPKRKCRIPSEGFNLQLATRMEKVDTAFHTYMCRKQELLSYILATASQAQKRNAGLSKTNNPRQRIMDRAVAAAHIR